MVHDIAGGEHARDAGLGRIAVDTGLHFDVAVLQLQLALKDGGVRAVADGVAE